MVLNLMIGLLHPPMGMVLFVLARVAGLSFERTTMAILPWLVPLLVSLAIITYAPSSCSGCRRCSSSADRRRRAFFARPPRAPAHAMLQILPVAVRGTSAAAMKTTERGPLVAGHPLAAPGDDRFLARRLAGARDDDRAHRLAPFRVGTPITATSSTCGCAPITPRPRTGTRSRRR
jgi:hypothetical protein